MREYTNYPKNIESNTNIIQEVKKPKLYLVTSKIVNLFAVFVASISVSTFFATRYIGIGDIFFSANIFSTMLSVSLFIVILEIYGRKNSLKAFMAGSYAILLVFFVSAFIADFNPIPIGYYQSSFINFHQTVLLSVFISYILSFLACIKMYTYMKDDLDVSYIWAKAIPAIAVSQIIYTISYYLIYNGFSNLDLVALSIKSELYLKFFMMIISILIIYFIISGIKSGFFDLFKNAFASKNIRYIDSYEHNPIKSIYDEDEQNEISYNKPMSLGSYRENYSPKRNKRYLPDYSEENGNYDPRDEYAKNNQHESQYKKMVEETIPQLRKSRRNSTENQIQLSARTSSGRTNRKAIKRSAKPIEKQENYQEKLQSNNQPRNNITRGRTLKNNRSSTFKSTQVAPKIIGINKPNNTGGNMDSFSFGQQNNQFNNMANKIALGNNNQFGVKPSLMMRNQNNAFGGNNNFLGNKNVPQNQQSFFANKLNLNNKPTIPNGMGGFNNMNKNNTWNKR